jgi:quercetin dioxygenase-like cupin family protein
MSNFTNFRTHIGFNPDKQFKATMFKSQNLMLGLNCLEPGQEQKSHTHDAQDKFYYVVEGVGDFVVGDEERTVGEGSVIWAPAGVSHGVTNNDNKKRLVLLVGIAPFAK